MPTLANAQAAGFDARGSSAYPLLVATPIDVTGRVVGSAPDIGAWQQGSTTADIVPPSAPTGVMVQ